MGLFQNSVLQNYLKKQDSAAITKAYKKFTKYFHNPTIQQNIREIKEEGFQQKFLMELFVNIFGYVINPDPKYNLTTEFKNEKGAKKADGAILVEGKALAVIELKSTKTKDLESIRQQAFDYKANQSGCVYVITSNFEKLRFYINNAVDFEEFNLFTLTASQFELLYLCLQKENVLANIPLKIKEASIVEEEKITKTFYADYSLFKRALFRDLVKNNLKNEVFRAELNNGDSEQAVKNIKLALFKKSQKLIDRFLFIFFAEDRDLLPPNSTLLILNKWKEDIDYGDARPLYAMFKLYFHFLDTGRRKTDKRAEIFAYNGGLFKPDAVLDSLLISDTLLYEHTKTLSNYDFDSQVDVNILGHIFENSLNEIESVNAEIEGTDFDKQKTKRKKDGVFYTPKYITKYIVDNTVGKLCVEKRVALGIDEKDYFKSRKGRTSRKLKELQDKLEVYRIWLLQLTILDPACGSGAFLNQALDFLIKEHGYIDELQSNLLGGGLVFPNIENTVLENNIFGVDLNEESVEIAKLSLWLRTAQPRRKLNSLNSNIKCGNSLIDDKAVAGDKAFKWEEEFAHIFKEKEKKAFHITTALHDSRTSARMEKYKVREKRALGTNAYPSNASLTKEDDLLITKTIAGIVVEDNLKVLAYNICGDHLHLLLVCNEDDVPKIIQKIKAISSRAYNIEKGITIPIDSTRGHVPLSKEGKKTYNSLWTQKFGCKEITTDEQLQNTIDYIAKNRSKHELPQHSRKLNDIIDAICCDFNTAFGVAYKGGFDIVIGNPPYVNLERMKEVSKTLEKQGFDTYNKRGDLYILFVEQGFNLLKKEGVISYIMPNKWLQAGYGKSLREYFLKKELIELIDFGDIQIFDGATTYPCIFNAKNSIPKKDFSVSVLKATNAFDFDSLVRSTAENFETSQFSGDTWVISSKKEKSLLTRLKRHNKSLEEFVNGEANYGIKFGLTEAFLIDDTKKDVLINEDTNSKNIIGAILRGRDLTRYGKPNKSDLDSIIMAGFGSYKYLENDYPAIYKHLMQYETKLKKRGQCNGSKETLDKPFTGQHHWLELDNNPSKDYLNLYDKPKIMYQAFQVKPCFIYDEQNLYCNNSMWIIPTDNKALLGVLNSKMGWWLITKYCTQIQNGCQLIWKYFGQIPIPELSNPNLLISTEQMLDLQSKQQSVLTKFTKYLQSQFPIDKLTRKLQNWHELEFGEFIKELNKAIKKVGGSTSASSVTPLTKLDEMEWMDVFETKKVEAQTLKAEIDKTDAEIDRMVYKLYNLTEEEIQIVEQS